VKKDYYIRIPHFYSFEYYEDDKKMIIELDFRDSILYLIPSMLRKWEKPFDNLEISYQERLQILNNIRECLLKKWSPEEVIIEIKPIGSNPYTFGCRADFNNFAMEIIRNLELIGGYKYLVKELNNWNATFFAASSEFYGVLESILIRVNAIDSLDQSVRQNISLCLSEIYKAVRRFT
jgi:hypothetical protein